MDRKERQPGRVSMKDIAEAAGVYPSAVSAVLNNRSYTRISPERREHIRKVAEELGYRANLQATCLRRGRKAVVGVFLPEWRDMLILELIKGMEREARRLEIPLRYDFGMTMEAYERFIDAMTSFRHTAIVSYVPFWTESMTRLSSRLAAYMAEGGQVIGLNAQNWPMPQSTSLRIDDYEGGRLAAKHLRTLGCRSYAAFGIHMNVAQERLRGFSDALDSPPGVYYAEPARPVAEYIAQIDRLRRECDVPVGIFCAAGDQFSNYLSLRLPELGWKQGRDFHLVAYDYGSRGGDYPPTARIIQPFEELGAQTIRQLETLLSGREGSEVTLNPTLKYGE